jgi:hypothetical protein
MNFAHYALGYFTQSLDDPAFYYVFRKPELPNTFMVEMPEGHLRMVFEREFVDRGVLCREYVKHPDYAHSSNFYIRYYFV